MTDDLIDRAKLAYAGMEDTLTDDSMISVKFSNRLTAMVRVFPELVRELEKWRAVAEEVEAFTPDELESEISVMGSCIQIGKWGHWGLYALEGLFEDLGIQPGDNYPEAVARVQGRE